MNQASGDDDWQVLQRGAAARKSREGILGERGSTSPRDRAGNTGTGLPASLSHPRKQRIIKHY